MKKIMFLLFLATGVIGCSVDSLDTNEELLTADAKMKVQETEDPMGFYSGNSSNLQGTLSVWNDCDNLYIEILPADDDPEAVKLGLFQGDDNPKENGTESDLTDLDISDGLVWAFPLSEFDESTELRIFAKAWGDFSGTIEWGNKASYLVYEFEEVTCEEEECESGYMEGNTTFEEIDESKNWGWANEFSFTEDGSEKMDILKSDASGNHEPTKIGEVSVHYENGNISLSHAGNIEITHLYVSEDKPKSSSPGQFDKTQEMISESGNFWIIIKAEVCE